MPGLKPQLAQFYDSVLTLNPLCLSLSIIKIEIQVCGLCTKQMLCHILVIIYVLYNCYKINITVKA